MASGVVALHLGKHILSCRGMMGDESLHLPQLSVDGGCSSYYWVWTKSNLTFECFSHLKMQSTVVLAVYYIIVIISVIYITNMYRATPTMGQAPCWVWGHLHCSHASHIQDEGLIAAWLTHLIDQDDSMLQGRKLLNMCVLAHTRTHTHHLELL